MTKLIFRDLPAAIPPDVRGSVSALVRCSVIQSSPQETAERVMRAGEYPYLTGLYDDAFEGQFPTDDIRIEFWSRWVEDFAIALGEFERRPDCLCIEHPRSMGERRLHANWMDVFEIGLQAIEDEGRTFATQFGVYSAFYVLPLPPMLSEEAIWLNIPGQYAWREKWSDMATFRLGLAWAAAHRAKYVVVWSNPLHPPHQAMLDDLWDELRHFGLVGTRPVHPTWTGDFESYLAELAAKAKGGLA